MLTTTLQNKDVWSNFKEERRALMSYALDVVHTLGKSGLIDISKKLANH